MKFSTPALLLLGAASIAAQECSTTWKCMPTTTAPVLDADHSEWADVTPYSTNLVSSLTGAEYDAGTATYKCMYDENRIYFAMEIPGEYRFDTEDNHLCAAIGTMMKVGPKATFVNMGGCPDAMGGCENGVPDTCTDYLVDIGAHWELKTTEQNTYYGIADSPATVDARQADDTTSMEPPGNDLIANNDDEYAVSPTCRFDDDDAAAGNEWDGAWAHTNSEIGEFGTYHFEMSRSLKTPSTVSDAQLTPGETVQFGLAFWDPYEFAETGWSDTGHFVTGCGLKWIDLELATGEEAESEETESETESKEAPSAAVRPAVALLQIAAVFFGLVALV